MLLAVWMNFTQCPSARAWLHCGPAFRSLPTSRFLRRFCRSIKWTSRSFWSHSVFAGWLCWSILHALGWSDTKWLVNIKFISYILACTIISFAYHTGSIWHCIETILLGIGLGPTALSTRLMSEELNVLSGPPQLCFLLEFCHYASAKNLGPTCPRLICNVCFKEFQSSFCSLSSRFDWDQSVAKRLPFTCYKKSQPWIRTHFHSQIAFVKEWPTMPPIPHRTMEKADLARIPWSKKIPV